MTNFLWEDVANQWVNGLIGIDTLRAAGHHLAGQSHIHLAPGQHIPCPPCIQEIPTFIDLQKSYSVKGFSVVAFSMDEGDPAPLYKLIEKYGINYPVLLADETVTRGVGGVTGIPVTFLVNRKGEIVKKYLGYVEHDVLESEIIGMLAAD